MMCRSVPQIPQPRTRTTTSPGPGSGSGTRSTATEPGALTRIARMASLLRSAPTRHGSGSHARIGPLDVAFSPPSAESSSPQRQVAAPARSALVLKFVPVATLDIEAMVVIELIAIEVNAQSRTFRHLQAATLKYERLGDQVTALLGEMRVNGVADHRLRRREMHDSGSRDPQFAIAVEAQPEVECFTDLGKLHERGWPTPEVHVTENYVQGAGSDYQGNLLEGDAAHIRGKRNVRIAAHEAHPFDAPGWILAEFDVVLVERPQNADTRLDGPRLVRIDPDVAHFASRRGANATNRVNLVGRIEDTIFQLDISEAVGLHQFDGVVGDMLRIAVATLFVKRFIAVEHVGREFHLLFLNAAPQIAAPLAHYLAEQIPGGHFDCRASQLEERRTRHLFAGNAIDRKALRQAADFKRIQPNQQGAAFQN